MPEPCASAEIVCNTDNLQTMVNVIDNSGAAVAECVKVLKMKRHAKIGRHKLQYMFWRSTFN